MAQVETSSRPLVVLLTLQPEYFFEDLYEPLVNKIKAKATVKQVADAAEASTTLTGTPRPDVIIAADGQLARKKFRTQRAEAIQFVKDGGTLIFGLGFPSFTNVPEYKALLKNFDLPWEAGDYHRTDFDANAAAEHIGDLALPKRYSQKARHLKNVQRKHAVYLPSASSRIQSAVFPPDPVEDLTQAPAAFRSYGDGKLGYVGDVNMEEETHQVVLAMCGLLS